MLKIVHSNKDGWAFVNELESDEMPLEIRNYIFMKFIVMIVTKETKRNFGADYKFKVTVSLQGCLPKNHSLRVAYVITIENYISSKKPIKFRIRRIFFFFFKI